MHCTPRTKHAGIMHPLRHAAKFGMPHLRSLSVRVTVDTPSTNLVRKMTLALLNMPSLRLTTMNWE